MSEGTEKLPSLFVLRSSASELDHYGGIRDDCTLGVFHQSIDARLLSVQGSRTKEKEQNDTQAIFHLGTYALSKILNTSLTMGQRAKDNAIASQLKHCGNTSDRAEESTC
jgi:hypothetical protein